MLPRLGFEVRATERGRLCRRLAVDILGRGPTQAEREACEAEETDAIVDAWLDTPEHRLLERRSWAALIDYDAHYVWPPLVDDLDALTDELAAGKIGYPDFAGRVVLHPAFYARHTDADWLRAIFVLFLGRSARPDEVADLMPLLGIWWSRDFYDRKAPQEYFDEFGFSGCGCAEQGGCRSDGLGKTVDFGVACDRAVRLVDVSPDGGRFRSDLVAGPVRPLPRAPAELSGRLHGLGRALVARFDFYEAAVDRELRRYLGWWQSSFNQPETDLPEVRAALAEQLRNTGSLRGVKRSILTSVLYTQPVAHPDGRKSARWASGPRKLLPVEAWLESAALAVGTELARCDHRRPGPTGQAYREAVDALGGSCRWTPARRPSIGVIEAQRARAVELCEAGTRVVPLRYDFPAAAEHLVGRILGRTPTADEREQLASDMAACVADGGCATDDEAVRWGCAQLLTSVEFVTY